MGCQVEIMFPLAEVNDPITRAVFVDGMSNQSYGPGIPAGEFGVDSKPKQIGTDTILTPG